MKRIAIFAALATAACANPQPTRLVYVPDSLRPSTDEVLAMVVPAKGVQIYECSGEKWAFVAPEAELFDANGKRIGRHYAGPTWEAADGSKVAGSLKSRADAPQADAIPWLLLGAKSVGPQGAFSRVTSIQRVSTTGGAAPAGTCTTPGERARVAYTADYYLFTPR
jgi:hypothetical protein